MPVGDRYERQRRFLPVGDVGQKKLEDARVLILGCGALGSVVAEILARAGVGHLSLVDRDVVEWSNLQRQTLYTEEDARCGRAKADAASDRLQQINSEIALYPIVIDVRADNIVTLLDQVDLVIDGTDNFGTRFLLNDVSLENELPWVHGGCVGASGQVISFSGRGNPCFRCLVPMPPDPVAVETCDTAGVLGGATHAIASLQATAAIKLLVEPNSTIDARVLSIDFWTGQWRSLTIEPVQCPACTEGRRDFLLGNQASPGDRPLVLCGRDAVQIPGPPGGTIRLEDIEKQWNSLGRVERSRYLVRLHLSEQQSVTLFRDGRAVIQGCSDVATARSLYARFVGG